MPTPDLVTSPEAARILGRSPRTVHRLAETGELPVALRMSVGPNGALLFRRKDVERLAKARADARRDDSAESEVAS